MRLASRVEVLMHTAQVLNDGPSKVWINPSKCLVEKALERWSNTKMRADNTSVITLMLDPPGPPRAEVLRNKKSQSYSSSGLQIETRYQESVNLPSESSYMLPNEETSRESESESETETTFLDLDKNYVVKTRESLAVDPKVDVDNVPDQSEKSMYKNENDIQINEVSSSSLDYVDEDNTAVVHKKETRKTSLRSASKKDECTSSVSCVEVTEQTTTNTECRILRERKVSNTIQKRKTVIKNKLNLSMEKKRMLQNVLCKQNDTKAVSPSTSWDEKSAKTSTLTPSKFEETAPATKEISRVLRFSNRLNNKNKEEQKQESTRKTNRVMNEKTFKVKRRVRNATRRLARDNKRNSIKRS